MLDATLKGQCRREQLVHLLGYLQSSQANGRLALRTGQRFGHVFFEAGRVTHAEFRSSLGSEALELLLQLEETDFEFAHGVPAPTVSVFEALSLVLRRAGVEVRASNYPLELVPSTTGEQAQIAFDADMFELLSKLNGQDLRAIQASLGWGLERLFAALRALEESRVIKLERPSTQASSDFVDVRIMRELRQTTISTLGPLGQVWFEGALEELDAAHGLPQARWGEFLRHLAAQVPDEDARNRLVKAILQMRKRLGV